MRAMRRLDEPTFVELRDATGLGSGALHGALRKLCSLGKLTRVNSTNTGRRWVYSVAVVA